VFGLQFVCLFVSEENNYCEIEKIQICPVCNFAEIKIRTYFFKLRFFRNLRRVSMPMEKAIASCRMQTQQRFK